MGDQFFNQNLAHDRYSRDLASAVDVNRIITDPDFATQQDVDIYEKIRREAVFNRAMELRRHLVAGQSWFMEPSSGMEGAKLGQLVGEKAFANIERLPSSLFNLAEAVFRGSTWNFMEGHLTMVRISEEQEVMLWLPVRLRDVDRRRFRQFGVGGAKMKWQLFNLVNRNWEDLENPEWFVKHIYEDTESRLGYGRGLIEALFFYLFAKTELFKRALQGSERWANGIIKAGVDASKSASTGKSNADIVADTKKELAKMRAQHILVHDKDDIIEVLTGGMEGHTIVTDMIKYIDGAAVSLILGSNLPTSATGGGSLALAQVQENSTEALIQFDRRLLEETLTRDVLGLVWRVNKAVLTEIGVTEQDMPAFKIAQEKFEDPEKSVRVISTALQSGVSFRKDEVYAKLGMTPPTEKDIKDGNVIEPKDVPAIPELQGLPFMSDRNGKH